ncbi:hypothetical protein OO014_08455 [Intrasporangium calvum]|uniref:Uncharacterized protein n=1 Tax=Intrasporangium calvum TaxID=53358 RepID=A0ABT5GHI2_9MICO|nr:hypothetical protein [Intrasporangium calvum]MDC5697285.1 hypothetical protein [Intrasporangium calvum]
MAADAESGSVAPAASWTPFERGRFMFGRCDICGFETPARRASYSVGVDMQAHALLCRAEEAADVASGRERLSAQGRS